MEGYGYKHYLFCEEERSEGNRPASDASASKEDHPESAAAEATKPKAPVTYQVSEQPSTRVQEEEFAKQLRLARYLAAGGSPPSRALEPVPEAKAPKRAWPIAKAGAKTKAETVRKKAQEKELAKERRRAGRISRRKAPPSGQHRDERQRSSPGR